MIIPLQPNAQSCLYRYDPLDHLIGKTTSTFAATQRFYLKDRLVTEIQGLEQRTIFQYVNQLLAQQKFQSTVIHTHLLVTDQQRSILHALGAQKHSSTYTPYGHHPEESDSGSVLEFNGERRDCTTGHYLLGNGYRAYNPVLMRFNSPDSLSPFGEGGLNPYAYCLGNPVNNSDPTGHFVGGLISIFTALSTKVTAALALGINLGNAQMLRNVGRISVGSTVAQSLSAGVAGLAVGLTFSPFASSTASRGAQSILAAVEVNARPLAQAALVSGTTFVISKLVPAAWRRVPPIVRETLRSVSDTIRVSTG